MVEYHSASMNHWIPARVVRAGRVHGTIDLDCKEAVDLGRVRLPPGAAAPAAAPPVAPTCPRLGAGPATAAGPLGLQAGDCCFYKSSTHGWISAAAVRYRPDENTYDLDVKQQVGIDKIKTIADGTLVEYLSTSTNQWIPAKVIRKGQNGNFDLDCKAGVHISRLRIPAGSGGSAAPVIPDTMPQGLPSGGYRGASANSTYTGGMRDAHHSDRVPGSILKQSPSGADRDPKLDQLRQALQAEDAVELRKRMESRSALNFVGEELDHAQHALWVMEARPEALKDLKRACARNSIDELQAALEAAAVVGVSDEELEAASRRLFALQARMWRYDAGDGRHMDLRKEPRLDGPRIRQRLNSGDVFEVAEERRGPDGVTFLRLADGRGWSFSHKPGVGTMCTRLYAEEEARRSQMGNQPISLTIADLRSQHSKAMKANRNAVQMAAIAEEDSPGPYVVLERTAVTPALALCNESDIVTTLDAGTVVDVLEVTDRPELKRIRGRISHPRGWVSLLDTKTGKRWAEKQSY